MEMMGRQRRGHSGDLGLRENKQRASYMDTVESSITHQLHRPDLLWKQEGW